MRRISAFALAAALLLLCAACGRQAGEEPGEGYVLYFTAAADGEICHGPAIAAQPWEPKEGESVDPGVLLQALLSGPAEEGLTDPFPKGLSVRTWERDPEQPGHVRVSLSEQYSGLTDISLTLADYCIVLTLTQLEDVESVEIISAGHTVNYRSHQLLLPEEAVLTDEAAWSGASQS